MPRRGDAALIRAVGAPVAERIGNGILSSSYTFPLSVPGLSLLLRRNSEIQYSASFLLSSS
jgi:hypothetical protein